MELVRRLDIYRLENKISQQSLAAKLGVSFVTVNRWFNDKTKPNKIQQYHIEKFLNNKASESSKFISEERIKHGKNQRFTKT